MGSFSKKKTICCFSNSKKTGSNNLENFFEENFISTRKRISIFRPKTETKNGGKY
jgi:hypothetical protein